MPVVLNRPSKALIKPEYYHRVVIPQASVRTLYSVPYTILPSNPDENPFLDFITIEKLAGDPYTGSTSANLVIDAIKGGGSTAAELLSHALSLGIVSGKSVFRTFYTPNDTGAYAGGALDFGKYYRMRLSVTGSDFNAGTGDVIVESFYTAIPRNIKL